MASISDHLSKSRGLLNALEAINNWRALLLLLGTGAAVALVMFLAGVLGAKMGSGVVAGLLGLIALAVGVCGFQSAGLLFMDQARGLPLRSFADAILGGIFSAVRLVGVLLLELLALIAWLLVLAVLFLICKIPGLGPLLYAILFPVTAVLTGLGLFALMYIGNTIAAPSVWDGNGVLSTISRLWVVSKQRGLAVLVSALLLMLLTVFASFVVFQVALLGVLTVGSVSAPVLGTSMGMPGMGMLMPMMMGGYGEAGGGGYLIAAGFGTSLLFAIGLTIPVAISMLGGCLIYIQAVDGLDFNEAEEQMKQRMSEAKRRMDEAKERAQQSMQRPEAPPAASSTESQPSCPNCKAAVSSDDVFCESCGHKLK